MVYLFQIKGVNVIYYYGVLDFYKNKENFEVWQEGRVNVMCVIVVFGMGIDKLDVCFVIYLLMFKLLECYVQEFGCVGRDGECLYFFIFLGLRIE